MIKIQVLNIPAGLPPEYLSDGTLNLDLPEGFDLSFFKGIEELTDLETISEEALLGFSLPATGKNKFILQAYDIENMLREPEVLQVIVTIDGCSIPQDRLYGVGVDDESDTIECEIIRSSEHWLNLIEFPICQTENLGNVEYNYIPMRAIITDNAQYEDGDPGFWFPMVNYGAWISVVGSGFFNGDSEAGISDFRPWVHVLSLLQKGFCQIGWTFRSELLESNYGRRLISYLLKEDFAALGTKAGKGFAASQSTQFTVPAVGDIPWATDMIYDIITQPSSFFDGQFFSLPGVFNFAFNFKFFPASNPNWEFQITVAIIKFNSSSGEETLSSATFSYLANNGSVTGGITAENVELGAGDIVFTRISSIYISKPGLGVPTFAIWQYQCSFSGEIIKSIPSEGDVIPLKDMLNCDYSHLDILKGVAHLFNFRFITDWATRTVTAFPADDIDVFGTAVNGYFRSDLKEIRPLGRSRSVINILEKTDRYALLEFKASTDPGIKELDFTEDNPIHSKRIDLGSKQNSKTSKFTNPFFEPTYNTSDTRIEIAGRPVDMPTVLDNVDNKLSFKIGPRIIYAHGNTEVFLGPEMTQVLTLWLTSFGEQPTYPYAYALMGDDHFINDGTGFIKAITNVVYGNVPKDLSRFWARALYSRLVLKSVAYSVLSNFDDYQKNSFRDLYRITYDGRDWIGRLTTIENQQTNNSLASYVFDPEPNIPLCDIIPEPEPEIICSNQPLILQERDENGCYTFSAGGVVNSEIDTTLIEISLNDGVDWTEQSEICCDEYEGEPFRVRLTQSYLDECPTQIRVVNINPCDASQNYSSQCVIVGNCFTIEVLGITDETFVIFYQINSNTEIEYTGEVCADYGDNITYRIVITSACCGEQEITGGCFIGPLVVDCNFEFGVECIDLGDGFRTFQRTGDIPFELALDLIMWRPAGGTQNDFCVWDCQPFEDCREFKRVLVFCDSICPVKCTPIFECNCDCEFLQVAINQAGNTLTAVHNCPFEPVFIWTNSADEVVGNEAVFNPTDDDTYTITIQCGDCVADAEIEFEFDCELITTEIEGQAEC